MAPPPVPLRAAEDGPRWLLLARCRFCGTADASTSIAALQCRATGPQQHFYAGGSRQQRRLEHWGLRRRCLRCPAPGSRCSSHGINESEERGGEQHGGGGSSGGGGRRCWRRARAAGRSVEVGHPQAGGQALRMCRIYACANTTQRVRMTHAKSVQGGQGSICAAGPGPCIPYRAPALLSSAAAPRRAAHSLLARSISTLAVLRTSWSVPAFGCCATLQIWDLLEENDLADFPRPVHHRIPNFKQGARRWPPLLHARAAGISVAALHAEASEWLAGMPAPPAGARQTPSRPPAVRLQGRGGGGGTACGAARVPVGRRGQGQPRHATEAGAAASRVWIFLAQLVVLVVEWWWATCTGQALIPAAPPHPHLNPDPTHHRHPPCPHTPSEPPSPAGALRSAEQRQGAGHPAAPSAHRLLLPPAPGWHPRRRAAGGLHLWWVTMKVGAGPPSLGR